MSMFLLADHRRDVRVEQKIQNLKRELRQLRKTLENHCRIDATAVIAESANRRTKGALG